MAVAHGSQRWTLADPRREPARLLSTVRAPAWLDGGRSCGSLPGLRARGVRTTDEEITARAVVIATDPRTAASLTGLPRGVDEAIDDLLAHLRRGQPTRQRLLHIDADLRGPVVNTAVMTAVAPSHAPAGRCLTATTTLGADGSAQAEEAARRHAGLIYGVDPERVGIADHPCGSRGAAGPSAAAAGPPACRTQRAPLCRRRSSRHRRQIQGAIVSGRRAATAVLAQLTRSGRESSGSPEPFDEPRTALCAEGRSSTSSERKSPSASPRGHRNRRRMTPSEPSLPPDLE